MSFPAVALAWLLSVIAAVGFGWGAHARYQVGVDAENNLESQRLAARSNARTTDGFIKDRIATERRAADVADSLRQLAASAPAVDGCPARNEEARPAAWLLPDPAQADLVDLLREADATADELRACLARESGEPEPVGFDRGRLDR